MVSSRQRAAAADPAQAVGEAVALHRAGRLDEAERAYARLNKLYPQHFDVLHLSGLLKHQRGKSGEAFRLIGAALQLMPDAPDALANLAMVLHSLKRPDEALNALDRALARQPAHVEALANRAVLQVERGHPAEALRDADSLLAAQPGHPQGRLARAGALFALGRTAEAVAEYDALLAAPSAANMPPAMRATWHYNRGTALAALDRTEEALASFETALLLQPGHAGACNNRGNALHALMRLDEAVASFEQALAIDRGFADAHYNLALALLTRGDFARGLPDYEWRWKRSAMAPYVAAQRARLSQPAWRGEFPLTGKTILLHAEQGFGDTIQFVRDVPRVAAQAKAVVLEVQPELVPLLAVQPANVTVLPRGEALPRVDVQCPLGSLPLAFGTRVETIAAATPYLAAPAEKVSAWRARLAGDGPLVALAWAGHAAHVNDRNRSVALERLAPLVAAAGEAGIRLVSIQKDLPARDAEQLAAWPQIVPLGEALADFSDTAAVLACADLLVCVDTAVAHLAGALARPVAVMLPFMPDWRWLTGRSDSPWYQSLRLFRQPRTGDWEAVIAEVTTALPALLRA